MIILVEGIDRVGKTTLCNKLSNTMHVPIYKHPNSVIDYKNMDNINETDKMLQLLDICKISNTNIIFDRFHISDYVYGIIERQYDHALADKNLKCIDTALSELNAILILVCPTDINESSRQHGKALIEHQLLMKDAYNMSALEKYMCDYNLIDKIVANIKEKYNGAV